ncbi:MAG: serine protease [Proteobacteria bacterium]|nr:serine protease [Pseudomonadota bacterium]
MKAKIFINKGLLSFFSTFFLNESIIYGAEKTIEVQKNIVENKSLADDSSERSVYNNARKFVVMISTKAYLTADSWSGNTSSWKGSGFILNKEKGLIATNKHVVGELSVSTYDIKFHDGTVLPATYVYADPIYDFAIIKVDPKKIPESAAQGELDTEPLKVNEAIYSIGNSAGDEFSVHKGIVFSTFENLGPFSEQSFQFSGVTVGGASGSPVIGENNKIKGILYGGKFVSGAGLPIAYITRILKSVENEKEAKRFTTGAIFEYLTASDALEANLLSKEDYDLYKNKFKDAQDKIISVSTRVVNSPAFDTLKPGDIILNINEKLVGPELLMIDEMIDHAGICEEEINFTILRDSKKIDVKIKPIPLILDSDFDFIQFAGALWSDVSEKIRLKTGIPEGVLILQTDATSAFHELGGKHHWGMLNILVKRIDGKPLKNLKDLENMIPDLLNKKNFIVEYINQDGYESKMSYERINDLFPRKIVIKYNKKFDTPKVYKRDPKSKEWDTKLIVLDGK